MQSYQGGEGAGEAEFQRISETVSSNIQKIIQNVSSMKRMIAQLGTVQDNESLRSQLHQLQNDTNQLAKDTHRSCRTLDTLAPPTAPSAGRQWKMQRERLTNDFTSALANFQEVQRSAADKEREEMRRARAESAAHVLQHPPHSSSSSSTLSGARAGASVAGPLELVDPAAGQMQTQALADEEERMRELRERETAVRRLEDDIRDVNQIFRDLASMVHEQGEVIDSIEAHVEQTHGSVQQGVQQLGRASHYQNQARKKKLCLLVFVVVAVVIVIAIIVANSK